MFSEKSAERSRTKETTYPSLPPQEIAGQYPEKRTEAAATTCGSLGLSYDGTAPTKNRTRAPANIRQSTLSGELSAARSDAGPDYPDRLPGTGNGTTQLRGTEQTAEKAAMQKQEPIRMRSPEVPSFAEALPGRNLSYGHFVLPLRSCLLRRAIRTARPRAKHRTTAPRPESMRSPNRCLLCLGSGAGRARSGERDPGPD